MGGKVLLDVASIGLKKMAVTEKKMLQSIEWIAATITFAFFAYLLVTNQRLTFMTTTSMTDRQTGASISQYHLHVGTAFLLALLLVPRGCQAIRQIAEPRTVVMRRSCNLSRS